MGIENVSYLKDHDPEEFHVVVVGRAGNHPGSHIYIVGPGPKRLAISTGLEQYRKQQNLGKNIQLVSQVVFSGTEKVAQDFHGALMKKMIEEQVEVEHLNVFDQED